MIQMHVYIISPVILADVTVSELSCALLLHCFHKHLQVERAVETEVNTGPARRQQAGSAAGGADGQASAAEEALQARQFSFSEHNVCPHVWGLCWLAP
jgi:hypothetical protein